MKKKNNKQKTHSKMRTSGSRIKRREINMQPEELAAYIRRAEKEILSTIKSMELSAGTALVLLAQYTQALVTGDTRITVESTNNITNYIIVLWELGLYQPGPEYPFSLEETRFDLQNGVHAQKDYSSSFQPFVPMHPTPPRGVGQLAGGIVQHPKTHLWQIWMMFDGTYEFLGAYLDPFTAQKMLEEIINITRQGKGPGFAQTLYQKVVSRGDGESQQIPFDMMLYLMDHLHMYRIDL